MLGQHIESGAELISTIGVEMTVESHCLDSPVRRQGSGVRGIDQSESIDQLIRNGCIWPTFQQVTELGEGAKRASGTIAGHIVSLHGPVGTLLQPEAALLAAAQAQKMRSALEIAMINCLDWNSWQKQSSGWLMIDLSLETLSQLSSGSRIRLDRSWHWLIRLSDPVQLTSRPDIRAWLEESRCGLVLNCPSKSNYPIQLWNLLMPEWVVISQAYIEYCDREPERMIVLEELVNLGHSLGIKIIAEGVMTEGELRIVRDLGIDCAYGRVIARPLPTIEHYLPARALNLLGDEERTALGGSDTAGDSIEHRLLEQAPSVSPDCQNADVLQIFEENPATDVVVVVDEDRPIGLITRLTMIDRFARPFRHELYDRKPCSLFMDRGPLIIDKGVTIPELGQLITASDPRHLANGVIITSQGRYCGISTGHAILREITLLQVEAARHANPLTQLPGNAPIQNHTNHLLLQREPFVATYFDLDQFKPFNDVYSFAQGDEIIRTVGHLLREEVDLELDFIGHIGGDDFVVLFLSRDWEQRCHRILDRFSIELERFFSEDVRQRGGYLAENRRGQQEFHSIVTLSIGAVPVTYRRFNSFMELATAASETKKMAKRIVGNALFIDRRGTEHQGLHDPVSYPPPANSSGEIM